MNHNYTIIKYILITLFVNCIVYSGATQLALDTKSGQQLEIADDGSFTTLKSSSETSDNEGFMGEEIDGLANTPSDTRLLSIEHRSLLKDIVSTLKEIEAKNTVSKYHQKTKLKELKDLISRYRRNDVPTDTIAYYNDRYEMMKVKYDIYDMKTEVSYELLKKTNDVFNSEESDRVEKINNIITKSNERLATDFQLIINENTDYSFDIDNVDPDLNSEESDCNIVFNGEDKTLGKKRIEFAPQHFFGYTNQKLKHFFKENNFMNCSAYLTKLGGDYFLHLDFNLATKSASKSYGFINKDDMIKITLINGDSFIANSLYRAEGQLESYSGHTKFNTTYKLDDLEIDILENVEIDKIGVIWSSGFEEYPVYEVDLLMRQIECIEDVD